MNSLEKFLLFIYIETNHCLPECVLLHHGAVYSFVFGANASALRSEQTVERELRDEFVEGVMARS